jgi:hypothetical protein
MEMTSLNPKFETKWTRAKKMFNAKMRDLDNDGSKAIQYFIDEAARQKKLAKQYPASVAHCRARFADNAATYGINLAFGINKAS